MFNRNTSGVVCVAVERKRGSPTDLPYRTTNVFRNEILKFALLVIDCGTILLKHVAEYSLSSVSCNSECEYKVRDIKI